MSLQPPNPSAGLCATCRHASVITSARGGTFIRCDRSGTDPRFDKYPRLPVSECPGFEDNPPDDASIKPLS